MSTEHLTEREQRVLEHLRRAQELKVGLAEYARQAGVDVGEIYSGKQSLVRKGVIAGRVRRCDTEGEHRARLGQLSEMRLRFLANVHNHERSQAALLQVHWF
jgi:hypothetical protein